MRHIYKHRTLQLIPRGDMIYVFYETLMYQPYSLLDRPALRKLLLSSLSVWNIHSIVARGGTFPSPR
jgi:hypothetical protein